MSTFVQRDIRRRDLKAKLADFKQIGASIVREQQVNGVVRVTIKIPDNVSLGINNQQESK